MRCSILTCTQTDADGCPVMVSLTDICQSHPNRTAICLCLCPILYAVHHACCVVDMLVALSLSYMTAGVFMMPQAVEPQLSVPSLGVLSLSGLQGSGTVQSGDVAALSLSVVCLKVRV
jgi:hypothetical protein